MPSLSIFKDYQDTMNYQDTFIMTVKFLPQSSSKLILLVVQISLIPSSSSIVVSQGLLEYLMIQILFNSDTQGCKHFYTNITYNRNNIDTKGINMVN